MHINKKTPLLNTYKHKTTSILIPILKEFTYLLFIVSSSTAGDFSYISRKINVDDLSILHDRLDEH